MRRFDKDDYDALGLEPGASLAEIKRAYRKLAKEHHPDRAPHARRSAVRWQRINQAYQNLLLQKATPDAPWLKALRAYVAPISVKKDISLGIDASLKSLLHDQDYRISYTRSVACTACAHQGARPTFCNACQGQGTITAKETLSVSVKGGSTHQSVITYPQAGHFSSGTYGDLHVILNVHMPFGMRRDGNHLRSRLKVGSTLLRSGGSLRAITLDGTLTLKVPAGFSDGGWLRIKGKGLPDISTQVRGDHLIQLYSQSILAKSLAELRQRLVGLPAFEHLRSPQAKEDILDGLS